MKLQVQRKKVSTPQSPVLVSLSLPTFPKLTLTVRPFPVACCFLSLSLLCALVPQSGYWEGRCLGPSSAGHRIRVLTLSSPKNMASKMQSELSL